MDSKTFDKLIEEQFDICRSVLCDKAGMYAKEDRLHNFKIAATLEGGTPRQALVGMMAKHTVSVYDMGTSTNSFPSALWMEKITDSINYLLLLSAVVQDEGGLTPGVYHENEPEIRQIQIATPPNAVATSAAEFIDDLIHRSTNVYSPKNCHCQAENERNEGTI